jgi:hypothetical protein
MKSLLLIDDKEEFKEAFQTIAQRKGYHLAWGKSFEELEAKLPELHRRITAVVLDIKCLITNNQPIEDEKFIGRALTFLNRKYEDIPRVILTGDEQAFEKLSSLFDGEFIFKKDPIDIESMFQQLDEYSKQHDERIKTADEREFYKIIQNSEGRQLEFKSTLQYCTKTNAENVDLRFEVLKTLAAFANTEGGTLLIGVKDDKSIYGLENGDFLTINKEDKIDAYKQLIDNLIEKNFGNGFHAILEEVKFYKIGECLVCRITIKGKYAKPLYIERKRPNKKAYQAFFIRAQSSTRELQNEDQQNYIKENWK